MTPLVQHLLVYLLGFTGIWIGSGLAIKSIERISRSLRLSSFSVSFLLLGFFTSVSEISVGVNSVLHNDPEIFVGNLIGASIVIFLLLIPLLSIVGNTIRIQSGFSGLNLLVSLVVVSLPAILSIDGKIDRFDGIVAILAYITLAILIESKNGLINAVSEVTKKPKSRTGKELVKIMIGVGLVFVASKFVVDQTLYLSDTFGVSPFLISLLLIGIGTNIPELSFALRSIFFRNNQVAFGDYIGSSSFNTFIFGGLTLWYGKTIVLSNSYLISVVILIFGLILFYQFAKSKNTISRKEGLAMLLLYFLFVTIELLIH